MDNTASSRLTAGLAVKAGLEVGTCFLLAVLTAQRMWMDVKDGTARFR